MTLPFESDNRRKYVCFCCGQIFQYNEFKEYKEHIIENHEISKEYLVCPLNRCKCPVRDIRSHFRIFHPTEKLPKDIQMQVMVWKDQKTGKRKKLKFAEGFMISIKNNGKSVHYRSSYEKQVYECLEKLDKVASYQVEPFKIPYVFQGKQRNYWPDLRVNFVDGLVQIVEIKPERQKNSGVNIAKWSACRQLCGLQGWEFKVLTEDGIAELLLEVGGLN